MTDNTKFSGVIQDASGWASESVKESLQRYVDAMQKAGSGNYKPENFTSDLTNAAMQVQRDMARILSVGVAFATALAAPPNE
ncbi:MAG: hypothetical protein KDB02_00225 [Acidimicrobiales bacterium]|nr:hypothetical protein [Acidimicrobiales bacterium]